jgi:protein-S-isoprenylcysteine O-methyltransferase Ste14
MKRASCVPLFHVSCWCAVLVIGAFCAASLPLARELSRVLGGILFFAGMLLFAWAVAHLRGGFLGHIEPRGTQLVTDGPYRWVRHPAYLGMIVTTLGMTLALRSLWGCVAVLVLFVPASMYRAWCEEKALAATFGAAWQDYTRRSAFLIPFVW